MPKKAHSEEQIVAVLQQGQAGEKVADICRKVGISEGDVLRVEEAICRLGHFRTARTAPAAGRE